MSEPTSTAIESPVFLELNLESVALTDEQFFRLCVDNPELQFELSAERELIIMSPTGQRTGLRNSRIIQRLGEWTSRDGTGICFDSQVIFVLANGAKRAPDASWMLRNRWDQQTDDEKEEFGRLCPDFILELRSRTDQLPRLKKKMAEYIQNGARLGWLLDPYKCQVHVYRPGEPPSVLDNPAFVDGDPVLPGFRFDFQEILHEPGAK